MEPSVSLLLPIIHFNDVYDIEPENNQGGVSRFYTALQKYSDPPPLTLFSGDLFSPSHLSNIYFGKQMILPMNKFNINACCFGNHDFDYEQKHVISLKNETNFPWILSNVKSVLTKKPLGEGLEYLIIEKNNKKIGFMGLAEEEWLGLLVYPDESELIYDDYVVCAKKLINFFKEAKCDIIIALTHMRTHNDERLASEVTEIDLILGGHDHMVVRKQVNDTLIVKSGCNFNEFSYLNLDFGKNNSGFEGAFERFDLKNFNVFIKLVNVDNSFEENQELKEFVDGCLKETEKIMEKTIAFTEVALDTRFSIVRTQETAICNFFVDLIRYRYDTHISILNNGFMRSDCIIEPGRLTHKTINKMIPFFDTVLVLEAPGKIIIQALENGVSKYPGFDGRFPSVSGIHFAFDPKRPAYGRVIKESIVLENGEDFNEEKLYSFAVKGFIGDGKDGYDVLKGCKRIVDQENAMTLQIITSEFFNLPKSHFLEGLHHVGLVKHDKYVEKWKNLIASIRKTEEGEFIVIKPCMEGRITIIH